jgi:hypothetical protein
MKKTSFLFVCLAVWIGVTAQDTISSFFFDSSYYCQVRPDPEQYEIVIATPVGGNGDDSIIWPYLAKRFYTPDTLTIYGLAVAYLCVDGVTPWEETIYDTSWDNVYEYFSLYRDAVGVDSLVCISDSLKIHARNTPIAYFQNFRCEHGHINLYPAFYEKLFDSAYRVQGRFYVARTHRSYTDRYYDSVSHRWYDSEKRNVALAEIVIRDRKTQESLLDTVTVKHFRKGYVSSFDGRYFPDTIEWRTGYETCHMLMFPIVDTTSGVGYGPDTNGVAVTEVSMANRFVVLTPNPAKGRVRVVATCGLSHLTVYSPTGEAVLEKELSGTETALDIAGWAVGGYVVHVTTPLGTAVKKLLVR